MISELHNHHVNIELQDVINYITTSDKDLIIEVIDAQGFKKPESYLYDDNGYPLSAKILSYYELGYTMIISNVGRHFEEVKEVEKIVGNYWSNFYFGKGCVGVSPSFPYHNHDYDVVVKNIFGSSVWRVDGEIVNLQDQDVLELPKGTFHQVTDIEKLKLSLTCNLL